MTSSFKKSVLLGIALAFSLLFAAFGVNSAVAVGATQFPQPRILFFEFNQEGPSEKNKQILNMHAEFLKHHPEYQLQVHGYSDHQGRAEYNQILAKKRAGLVADVIRESGLEPHRIQEFSWGSDFPLIIDNHHTNRRVELVYVATYDKDRIEPQKIESDSKVEEIVEEDKRAELTNFGNEANAEKEIVSRLGEAVPGLKISSVNPSPIPGVYEVESNNPQSIYISADGQFFVPGDIFQVKDGRITNLAEKRREVSRSEFIGNIPEAQQVVFAPKDNKVKAKVTVFTDIDCGYCRKLHLEVPKMNALGIQINYMAFPRAGIGSSSYDKLVSVWCADDQQDAMTYAKTGKVPPPLTCENPVAAQYELGQNIGITGTPAIVTEEGRLIPGYLPAEALANGLGIAAQ